MVCTIVSPYFRGAIASMDQGGSFLFEVRLQEERRWECEGIRKEGRKGSVTGMTDKEGN